MATKLGKTGKQKNHSSSKKTFKKTGTGKIKVGSACGRHLLMQKSKRQKKVKSLLLAKGDSRNIKALAPSL